MFYAAERVRGLSVQPQLHPKMNCYLQHDSVIAESSPAPVLDWDCLRDQLTTAMSAHGDDEIYFLVLQEDGSTRLVEVPRDGELVFVSASELSKACRLCHNCELTLEDFGTLFVVGNRLAFAARFALAAQDWNPTQWDDRQFHFWEFRVAEPICMAEIPLRFTPEVLDLEN